MRHLKYNIEDCHCYSLLRHGNINKAHPPEKKTTNKDRPNLIYLYGIRVCVCVYAWPLSKDNAPFYLQYIDKMEHGKST